MHQYNYLLLNFASFVIPFLISFKICKEYLRNWRALLISFSITAALLIAGDIWFVDLGIWGFNYEYVVGWKIFNLPIEEILFFYAIPFSSIYIYQALKCSFPKLENSWINYKLSGLLLIFAGYGLFTWVEQIYSLFVFTFVILVISITLVYAPKGLSLTKFYGSILLLLPFFLFVNGVLTGFLNTNLDPIVWYNINEFSGWRVFSIPMEDFFYAMGMLLMNVYLFEWLRDKSGTKN